MRAVGSLPDYFDTMWRQPMRSFFGLVSACLLLTTTGLSQEPTKEEVQTVERLIKEGKVHQCVVIDSITKVTFVPLVSDLNRHETSALVKLARAGHSILPGEPKETPAGLQVSWVPDRSMPGSEVTLVLSSGDIISGRIQGRRGEWLVVEGGAHGREMINERAINRIHTRISEIKTLEKLPKP
jgi:hypothetical protein